MPRRFPPTSGRTSTRCSTNLFVTARLQADAASVRKNINTIDEVPDSSWFTNRIGADRCYRRARLRAARLSDAPPDPS